MGMQTDNILSPSAILIPGGTQVYGGLTNIPVDAQIRVIDTQVTGGGQTLYLTDDGTSGGTPLYTSIMSAQVQILTTGQLLGSAVQIQSNYEVFVEIYDANGIYGSAVDVTVVIIGVI